MPSLLQAQDVEREKERESDERKMKDTNTVYITGIRTFLERDTSTVLRLCRVVGRQNFRCLALLPA